MGLRVQLSKQQGKQLACIWDACFSWQARRTATMALYTRAWEACLMAFYRGRGWLAILKSSAHGLIFAGITIMMIS